MTSSGLRQGARGPGARRWTMWRAGDRSRCRPRVEERAKVVARVDVEPEAREVEDARGEAEAPRGGEVILERRLSEGERHGRGRERATPFVPRPERDGAKTALGGGAAASTSARASSGRDAGHVARDGREDAQALARRVSLGVRHRGGVSLVHRLREDLRPQRPARSPSPRHPASPPTPRRDAPRRGRAARRTTWPARGPRARRARAREGAAAWR